MAVGVGKEQFMKQEMVGGEGESDMVSKMHAEMLGAGPLSPIQVGVLFTIIIIVNMLLHFLYKSICTCRSISFMYAQVLLTYDIVLYPGLILVYMMYPP